MLADLASIMAYCVERKACCIVTITQKGKKSGVIKEECRWYQVRFDTCRYLSLPERDKVAGYALVSGNYWEIKRRVSRAGFLRTIDVIPKTTSDEV